MDKFTTPYPIFSAAPPPCTHCGQAWAHYNGCEWELTCECEPDVPMPGWQPMAFGAHHFPPNSTLCSGCWITRYEAAASGMSCTATPWDAIGTEIDKAREALSPSPDACPHCGLLLSIAMAAHIRHCELRPEEDAA